jgi:diguanylate cyclase
MTAMFSTVRNNPARLLRAFAIGAVIALVVSIGMVAVGVHYVYYANVCRAAELNARRLADVIARDARVFLAPAASGGDAFRTALDAQLRRDVMSLGLVELTMFDRAGRVAYSTASRRADVPSSDRSVFDQALAGETVSSFVRDGAVDGLVSYLPLRDGAEVRGGLRVVTDVSRFRREFTSMLGLSMTLAVAALLGVFGFLFVLVRSAARQVEAAQSELETMAVTDAVTGLANRRYLMARAAEECARIPRQRGRDPAKSGVGFIMADIDAFKTANDTHGHLAGDEILRSVAERIRRVTRRYDIVGRYGGDEFLVVVPGTDFDETGAVAERVWQIVREEPFTIGDGAVKVTMSVGFTCADGDDVTAALRRADEALYRAKQGGRDRVVPL